MSTDAGQLLASVRAVRDRMAAALAGGEPPFAEEAVAGVFGGIPGVAGPVVERVARLYAAVLAKTYDGGKLAVLVATATAAAALEGRPADPTGLAAAIRAAGRTVAEAVAGEAVLLRSPDDVLRVVRTAAGGHDGMASAILEAFADAGPDGTIHVVPAPVGQSGCRVEFGNRHPPEISILVGGRVPDETAELYERGYRALHAGRHAIAKGVLPGGGAAYLRAADRLRPEAGSDTVTAAAAGDLVELR